MLKSRLLAASSEHKNTPKPAVSGYNIHPRSKFSVPLGASLCYHDFTFLTFSAYAVETSQVYYHTMPL